MISVSHAVQNAQRGGGAAVSVNTSVGSDSVQCSLGHGNKVNIFVDIVTRPGNIVNMKQLPTFQQMRRDALRLLGDAQDVLRSDWPEGHGPTRSQANALGDARAAISAAKDALDRAAR
jgi:hypothetical protein